MNNRREFIKKGALAGIALSGIAGANNSLLARDDKISKPKNDSDDRSKSIIYKQISFKYSAKPGDLTVKAISIFNRILKERTAVDFTKNGNNPLTIIIKIVPQAMPSEAFRIENTGEHLISITASDENGIFYGIGKLLHTSFLSEYGFSPGTWRGLSAPEKPVRNIYFATHFHDFYHDAPVEKVINYIEELALWGYNAVAVWFDMHGFEGINDPAAVAMLDRLALILKAGQKAGMKPMIGILANEGYNSSPAGLRATTPKQIRLRGKYGVEICPSQPGGTELIMKQVEEELDAFAGRGITVDYLSIWPYDQGGCGCDRCTPWGSNGFLRLSKKIAALAYKKNPGIKIILSTWLFDCVEDEGEWIGLAKAFGQETPYVDYIMADSHETYPKYLMNNPVPGNLPLLNFPEISMWGSWPWGGFGANPLPQRFQKLWDTVEDKVAGGYPYSEGIFEDMNKIIYSQFYWDSRKPATETIREYVSFEFSNEHADDIVEAVGIIEKNHGLRFAGGSGSSAKFIVPSQDHGAEKAYKLLKNAESKLHERTKKGWRWRILLLRAMFDYELRINGGVSNEKIDAGFRELSSMYHANNAEASVRPPANLK